MSGVNKAIIVGHLGKDPELRTTQTNTAVCNFTVATSETWKDDAGVKQEKTEWHRIVAWGRLAEVCGQYLHKGKQVYIEGRLQTREWEDQQGQKKYTTEIVAKEMVMLGSRGDTPAPVATAPAAPSTAGFPAAPMPGEEDDLPFR